MAKLITVFWRDIPSQVTARQGRNTAKIQLSERFQEAIDRAAMRAGKAGTDAYLEEWRRESVDCSGDLEQAVQRRAAELDAAYDDQRLLEMVRASGLEPGSEQE